MEYIERYGMHTPQKKNTGLKIGIAILIVIIVAVSVAAGLIFSNPYKGRGLEEVKPSDNLARTAAASILTGKENSFSTDDVNAYLSYLFHKNVEGRQNGSLQMQAVAVAGASGNSAEVYIPVVYRGRSLGVSLNVTPSLDTSSEELRFQVNSAHVGRLPVPADWVLKQAEKHLPTGFWLEKSTVLCKAPSLKASALGVTASAGLTKLKMNDGTLTLAAKAQLTLG